ncbi:NUMOD3 domain-containing DNA-binding protein [Acinetobacter sp.]|uniref:NUMOD3 domain-containing DNA-binding protein n=1 Tax=Acinetobacter sp. TaxID=472 RepID=UPI00388EF935
MHVTYIALDPRKPGRFTTPFCSLLFQPVYVGKGDKYRARHINDVLKDVDAKPHSGELLHDWCVGMRRLGFTDVPIISLDADDEDHAFDMEGVLTRFIGIKPEGGILFNGRHGGIGGWVMTARTKELLSHLNTGENNPNWGTTWSDERRKKWYATIEEKRKAGTNKRTPESMSKAWEANQKSYLITSPDGAEFVTNNLTIFCQDNNHPLSGFRKALKGDGVVKSGSKKKSRIEGWAISYL